jgi:hypothetical protein
MMKTISHHSDEIGLSEPCWPSGIAEVESSRSSCSGPRAADPARTVQPEALNHFEEPTEQGTLPGHHLPGEDPLDDHSHIYGDRSQQAGQGGSVV